MARNYAWFRQLLAIAVENKGSSKRIADTNHPDCPRCQSVMDFHGGEDVPIGEGYWKCYNCGFKVTEKELDRYEVRFEENPYKYFNEF